MKDTLPKEISQEIKTPAIRVLNLYMSSSLSTNPIILVEFDQIVDSEQIVKIIKFKVGGIFGKKNYCPAIIASVDDLKVTPTIPTL